jgi:hypothetical protein
MKRFLKNYRLNFYAIQKEYGSAWVYGPDARAPADLPISRDKGGHYGFLD